MNGEQTQCPICKGWHVDSLGGFINHVEGRRHQAQLLLNELAKLDENKKLPKLDENKKLPKFNSINRCEKCDAKFVNVRPGTRYDSKTNSMERTCFYCGFHWYEECADGSQPHENHNIG